MTNLKETSPVLKFRALIVDEGRDLSAWEKLVPGLPGRASLKPCCKVCPLKMSSNSKITVSRHNPV
jgi:hypothetical protein